MGRIYAKQPTCPLWPLGWRPNFTSTEIVSRVESARMHFQPGKGPSDYKKRWIDYSSSFDRSDHCRPVTRRRRQAGCVAACRRQGGAALSRLAKLLGLAEFRSAEVKRTWRWHVVTLAVSENICSTPASSSPWPLLWYYVWCSSTTTTTTATTLHYQQQTISQEPSWQYLLQVKKIFFKNIKILRK